MDKERLEAAYASGSKEALIALYADWAQTYDTGFADARGYLLPGAVARTYHALARDDGPVLDVGAGTGLIGVALADLAADARGDTRVDLVGRPLHALDISAQMLAVADKTGCYSQTHIADLEAFSARSAGAYAGVVSAGTFTKGHLGTDALDGVMACLAPGGLAVLSINAAHYEAAGFGAKLAALGPEIAELAEVPTPIYGQKADTEMRDDGHGQDTALIVSFFRL